MATVTTTSGYCCIQPGMRLFTAADLAALPEQLPSGPVSFELHHGKLVPLSPPGARHGSLQVRLGAALLSQGEVNGHGKAYSKVGVVLERSPDHVLGPDAAFVMSRSLPAKISSEGFLETIPELIVEVRSKNDANAEIDQKIADYLNVGVQLVWIADPATETVVEHRPQAFPQTFGKGDSLQCEDIIPGFRLALAELFRQ